jgi:hypothetical protein
VTTAILEPTAEYPTVDPPAEPAYTGTGNPRTASTPGRRPGQKNGTGRTSARTGTPPPKRPAAPPKKGRVDYKTGVKGLLQLLSMVPAGLARFAKSPKHQAACMADVVAVQMHADPIAEAIDQTAQNDARLAAALDKVLTIGPYGLIIASVMGLGAQIAANHGAVPAGFMGAAPLEFLLGRLDNGDDTAPAAA